MDNQRNRIEKLANYIEKNGVCVNIGKNKARGNKGIFVSGKKRIDISKDMDEKSILSTLIHEFAHFVHYKYDKTLNTFDFLFPNITDDMLEELINITVQFIPKESAVDLFSKKEIVNKEIKQLSEELKKVYPTFSPYKPCKEIENSLMLPEKFLLKYDRVNYLNKVFSIDKLNLYDIKNSVANYLVMKSRQRLLKRINSRITRLNNYYNKPTELIARFIEIYYTNKELAKKLAPKCCMRYENSNISEFKKMDNIFIF